MRFVERLLQTVEKTRKNNLRHAKQTPRVPLLALTARPHPTKTNCDNVPVDTHHLGAFGERGWGSSCSSLTPALVFWFALLALDTIFLVALSAKATSRTPSTSATELGLIVSRTALASLQGMAFRLNQSIPIIMSPPALSMSRDHVGFNIAEPPRQDNNSNNKRRASTYL